MSQALPAVSVAEQLAERIPALRCGAARPARCARSARTSPSTSCGLCRRGAQRGLCQSRARGLGRRRRCTAIGHERTLSAAGAAFVNGTAAHGEDFDDTFEGGPVHAGAVIVPAVLAACERYDPDGASALLGIAVGVETLCRLSLVAPKAGAQGRLPPDRRAGRHGGGGRRRRRARTATGARSSMRSASPAAWRRGIIEYLAEGAWTKRLHPGWAAQAGLRAALLAKHGFDGPRTVFEGTHGFFHGFAHTTEADYDALTGDFGERWVIGDAGVQALSVRDHDASLHRLRAAAGGARRQAGRDQGDRSAR